MAKDTEPPLRIEAVPSLVDSLMRKHVKRYERSFARPALKELLALEHDLLAEIKRTAETGGGGAGVDAALVALRQVHYARLFLIERVESLRANPLLGF